MTQNSVKIPRAPFFKIALAALAAGVIGCGHSGQGPDTDVAPSPEAVRARWHNNQGVVYMDQHNYVRGRDQFLEATRLDTAYAHGFANLGISYYSLGEFELAQQALERAARLDPDHLHAQYTLGLIFQGQAYEKARTAFERVRQADPDDPLVHYYLGQVYGKLGQPDLAVESLKRTTRLDPFNVSAYYSLAQQFRKQGDMERFKQYLEEFTRLQQAGHQSVSQSYQGQGKYAEAEADAGYTDPHRDDARGPFALAATGTPKPDAPWAAALDWDDDGRTDLLVGGAAPRLLLAGRDQTALELPPGPWKNAVWGDVDNDGDADLVLCGAPAVLLNRREGGFAKAADLGPATAATFGDADHDGDLDLLLLGPAGPRLWSNDGQGTFADISRQAQIETPQAATQALFSDFDNDRDVDFFVAGPQGLMLFTNNRDGSFSDIAATIGLGQAKAQALVVEDFDQDGYMDLATLGADRVAVYLNDRGRGFRPGPSVPLKGMQGLEAADFDGDGDIDLAAYGEAGVRLLAWHADALHDDGPPALTAAVGSLVAADFDGDGDADLWGGGQLLDNDGAPQRWIKIAVQGLNSNLDGVGTKVEVKTTYRQQKREVRADGGPGVLTFGLGQADSVEFIRVLWPSGVRQTELAAAAGQTLQLTELDRKGTSCPILYVWDGERYRFVTDILGGAIIGYLTAPGQYYTPDTDEYVRLGPVAPRHGRYSIQLGNQLEEIIYMDAVELVAVDHDPAVEVYPNERLLAAPPYPQFKVYPLEKLQPPQAATDDRGRDLLPLLRTIDDDWHDGFERLDIHGYAEEHSIVLDLGPLTGIEHPVLLGYGWVDYAHSSSNWAAAQRGLALSPPRLEVPDGRGGWRLASADMGQPAGLPKHMLFDLKGLLTAGDHRLRITTNAAVYWDQILVGNAAPSAVEVHRVPATFGDLHWRGYPEHTSIKGTFAFRYHYDRLQTEAPWGTHAGAFTAFGEVTPLLEAADDRYVIMFHGDELTVEFDADALPPPAPGKTRSFWLYADGFGKDMDFHSAHSLSVEPLPFHGMSSYPYPPDEAYPQTAEHMDYRIQYNTRQIRGYYR